MGYYKYRMSFADIALGNGSDDMSFAGPRRHLHHYGAVGTKRFGNSANHLGLIGIKMNMLLTRH